MNQGRRNSERLKQLAAVGRVSGNRGPRRPETFWRVEITAKAFADAHRLFQRLSNVPQAHAVTLDALGSLALFPDKRLSVAGEILDLAFERVAGEVFYRLGIDDESFAGRSLCVFFYPVANVGRSPDGPGTIHVVGFAWTPQAFEVHVTERIRDRVEALMKRHDR